MVKYFCIKIRFYKILSTDGISHQRSFSRAASDFMQYKSSTIQILRKSQESLTFTRKSCKRDTNRDIKLHQLRDLQKARQSLLKIPLITNGNLRIIISFFIVGCDDLHNRSTYFVFPVVAIRSTRRCHAVFLSSSRNWILKIQEENSQSVKVNEKRVQIINAFAPYLNVPLDNFI